MLADVQKWLDDPSSNFGWLLLGDETKSRTTKRFDSSEKPGGRWWWWSTSRVRRPALRPNQPQVVTQRSVSVFLAEQAAALEFWDY